MVEVNIKIEKFYVFIPILLIANILIGDLSHTFLLDVLFIIVEIFLFTGFPFFTLGY